MPETPPPMEIRGGAGPYEVAAIVAAVTRTLAEDEATAAAPPGRQGQAPWVVTGRTRPVQLPVAIDPRPLDPWGKLVPPVEEPD